MAVEEREVSTPFVWPADIPDDARAATERFFLGTWISGNEYESLVYLAFAYGYLEAHEEERRNLALAKFIAHAEALK